MTKSSPILIGDLIDVGAEHNGFHLWKFDGKEQIMEAKQFTEGQTRPWWQRPVHNLWEVRPSPRTPR